MQYEVTRDMDIESVSYKMGQVIDEGDIPEGCFRSCVRMRWIVQREEDPPVEMSVATPQTLHAVPEPLLETAQEPKSTPPVVRRKRRQG